LLKAVPARSQAATAAVLAPHVPPLPDEVTAGLGAHGQRFVARLWNQFTFTGADLELLRQTARALDDAETALNLRDRLQAIKAFAALLVQLDVKE
jgi:hypothetical protein